MASLLLLDHQGLYEHLLRAMFRLTGHHCHLVRDSDAARRALGTGLFDLLLCNLECPREAMLEALAFRRDHASNVPLVGVNSGAFRECYKDFKFAAVLETPLNLALARGRVEQTLAAPKRLDDRTRMRKVADKTDALWRADHGVFRLHTAHWSPFGFTLEAKPKAVEDGVFEALGTLSAGAPITLELALDKKDKRLVAAQLAFVLSGRDRAAAVIGVTLPEGEIQAHRDLFAARLPECFPSVAPDASPPDTAPASNAA